MILGFASATAGSVDAVLEQELPADLVSRATAAMDVARQATDGGVAAAARAAGSLLASTAGSAETQRAAALSAALLLTERHVTDAPWIAPFSLGADARAAAVQLDRSGQWDPWLATWSALLAREAASAERAVLAFRATCETSVRAVGAARRVGGTDAEVLRALHATLSMSVPEGVASTGCTAPTVGSALERLTDARYAIELTGMKRDRRWSSSAIVALASSR